MKTLIMILVLFLFSISFVSSQPSVLDKTLSLNIQNEEFETALQQISASGNVYFSYKSDIIPIAKQVSIKVDNKTLGEVLSLLTNENNLEIKVIDNTIILSIKAKPIKTTFQISGFVKDTSNFPIQMAALIIKDSPYGVVTDENGFFRITLPYEVQNDTIVFSALSFKSIKMAVSQLADKEGTVVNLQSNPIVLKPVFVDHPKDTIDYLYLNDNFIKKQFTKINDTLWMGKYEVNNNAYRLFWFYLRDRKLLEKLKIAMIDSMNWKTKLAFSEPYTQFYFWHPAYDNYPVVNVKYDGTVLYCQWLTEKYNTNPKRKFKKVIFRLPSEKEWMLVAKGKDQSRRYAWTGLYLQNKNGQKLCNFNYFGDESIHYNNQTKQYEIIPDKNRGVNVPNPIDSFWPNEFGIYNLCGNAAEMLLEKGKVKGGSYLDSGFDLRLDQTRSYEGSATDLGFRIVMVVLEK